MIKNLTSLVLLFSLVTTLQAQKRDTTVLSVYNNNQRFVLYPMPFGKDRPDNDFVAEMVFAIDTIYVLKDDIKRDSTGKIRKKWQMERSCGKVPQNVKGKVALLNINATCDISTQVYNAQEAGALAVIVIHTTNSKDSVTLPKKSNTIKYDNDNKVKIPCFTVRKEIGMTLLQMSPSLVGIKRPKDTLGTLQSLTAFVPTDSMKAVKKAQTDSLVKAEYEKHIVSQTFDKIGWEVAPNPVSEEVTLHYNFTQKSTLNIEVFNELGQVLTTYNLPNTQAGKLNIDVSSWQTGAYSVSLISGSMREVKRLVVTH
jgi:Secretion system C-terminal sorting domain/PA domain